MRSSRRKADKREFESCFVEFTAYQYLTWPEPPLPANSIREHAPRDAGRALAAEGIHVFSYRKNKQLEKLVTKKGRRTFVLACGALQVRKSDTRYGDRHEEIGKHTPLSVLSKLTSHLIAPDSSVGGTLSGWCIPGLRSRLDGLAHWRAGLLPFSASVAIPACTQQIAVVSF